MMDSRLTISYLAYDTHNHLYHFPKKAVAIHFPDYT